MKNNKAKIGIGIIIILILIIGAFSLIMVSKNEQKKKNEVFQQNFTQAENINVAKNNNINNLFDLYLGKANEIMMYANNKFKDPDYQTLYGTIEVSNVAGDKFVKLENDLEKNIAQNGDVNLQNSLGNQKKIWEEYLVNQNNTLKGEKENTRLMNKGYNYLSVAANVIYFNIYNCLENNGINPQISENYFGNELASIGNINRENNLTEKQKEYIKKEVDQLNYTEIKGNNIINGAVGSKGSILEAYKEINTLWTTTLNEEYTSLKAESPNKEVIIRNETPWLTFKTAMCNEAGKEYTNGTESQLANIKMNIRLTQQQAFNLLSYS
ncbi:hypothetical protein [uncultured Clostridium sp.]|uniref:hypothetical protein n=1 Tax=uncultured Clostridium sp. TaxID=59620 RepID=UPI00260F75F7|nr:hypothetical protein [uncultured Clostridium sp.]